MPDDPIEILLHKTRRRDRAGAIGITVLYFVPILIGRVWMPPAFVLMPYLYVLLTFLLHLIYSMPAIAMKERIYKSGMIPDLLATPVNSAIFAKSFNQIFWKAALWSAGASLCAGIIWVQALLD